MLELKNIGFEVFEESGGKTKEILRDVNLVVEDKSFLVITGPNGGGKSSLAKVMMGIAQPACGQILFDGQDITALSPTERANIGMGFAFQQPVRFKGLTVFDLLSLAAKKTLQIDEACHYLSEVGLCAMDYINRELNASLSGGELKRIEIAMLIARAPALSIFDEPEAGIDLWSFNNLIKVFEKMRDTTAGAVVIISHQERILEIADQIVVVAEGSIAKTGSREEILPQLLGDPANCPFCKGAVS